MDFGKAFDTVFDYVPASRDGHVLYLAGQIPKTGPETIEVAGRVGETVTLEEARGGARTAAYQALAWLAREANGLENVERILRLTIYIAVADDFEEISRVADAASRVFSEMVGGKGRHPRSVIGAMRLPRNSPVLLEVTAALSRTESAGG